MKNNILGKYIIIDIGKLSTKVLVTQGTKNSSEILDADFFDTPSNIIENEKLKNFTKLAEFAKEVIETMGFKGNRVCLVSEHLDIITDIRKYNTEDLGAIEQLFESDPEGKRYPTNLNIRSFKTFKTVRSIDDIERVTLIDTANLEMMLAISKSFNAVGLEVVNISDATTSLLSLLQVAGITYDNPSSVFLNFNEVVKAVATLDGNPLLITDEFDCNINDLVNAISDEFGVTQLCAKSVLFFVGARMTEENLAELRANNIFSSDTYFDIVKGYAEKWSESISARVNQIIEDCDLESSSQIYGFGDTFDIPGFKELMTMNIESFNINSSLSNAHFSLTVKSKVPVTQKFGSCIGLALTPCFAHNINLVPTEKLAKSYDNTIIVSLKAISTVCTMILVILTIVIGLNITDIVYSKGIQAKLDKTVSATSSIVTNINKLDEYILASESTDSYLLELVSFAKEKSTSSLAIASIDSKSILETVPVVEEIVATQQEKEPVKKDKKEEKSEEAKTDVTKVLGLRKEPLILRGYSKSSAEISKLYDELKVLKFVKDANLKSITQEILPSLQTIYIFEIELLV